MFEEEEEDEIFLPFGFWFYVYRSPIRKPISRVLVS